ncbi:hypothetical protein CAPTEDRAFT_217875, partial [Capitella teleta]
MIGDSSGLFICKMLARFNGNTSIELDTISIHRKYVPVRKKEGVSIYLLIMDLLKKGKCSGQHELTANHWSVSTDVLMSSELDTWVLGSSRVNLQQASLASSPLTPVPGCTLLLALLLASMSTLYLKKNSKDAQGRSRSLQSESGFHEAFDVSPGIPYEEQMHLLAYKSSNHLNSNHVNHTILRGKQLQPDLNPSTGGHTSSFLEVPQSSLAL